MSIMFAQLFSVGIVCIALFVREHTLGRMSRNTTWSELTIDQWVLCIGIGLTPVGFTGMLYFGIE